MMLITDKTKATDEGECWIRMVFLTVWKYEALLDNAKLVLFPVAFRCSSRFRCVRVNVRV